MDADYPKNVLVAIDGSRASLMAEETAIGIAKKTGAEVTVLHMLPYRRPYKELAEEYHIPGDVGETILSNLEQRAQTIIDTARALFFEEGVKAHTEIATAEGDVAEGILWFAKGKFDLILAGAHGENEKDPNALGSVAKKLLMHTTVPLLIVKQPSTLSKILVCVDGSPNSNEASKCASIIGGKMGSRITFLNIQERQLREASVKTAKDVGQQILSRVMASVGKTKVKIDQALEFGVPSDEIVEKAEKGDYDLVVLGKKGYGAVERFLLGSVADDVAQKSKRSVLIVPKCP
jgi:nucleotide-binding universal stress UspA family protein